MVNSDLQNRYSLLIPETLIPNNSDLNDYTTPGQYYVSTAANSKTIKNCPYTLSGFKLTVEKMSSDGHILQTLKAANAKYIYYRTAADSNFNEWLTPVTNADLATGTQEVQFSSNSGEAHVNFGKTMPNVPAVILTPFGANPESYHCSAYNVTQAGFDLKLHVDNVASGSLRLYWVAITRNL